VAEGTPEDVAQTSSPTGAFLSRIPEIAKKVGVAAD
jgi:excinuclease ABC subunit A